MPEGRGARQPDRSPFVSSGPTNSFHYRDMRMVGVSCRMLFPMDPASLRFVARTPQEESEMSFASRILGALIWSQLHAWLEELAERPRANVR